jgi:copper chaperone CopZ
MTIKNELSEIKGVSNVEGNPASKTVIVEWDAPATLDQIQDTLKEINFPAVS